MVCAWLVALGVDVQGDFAHIFLRQNKLLIELWLQSTILQRYQNILSQRYIHTQKKKKKKKKKKRNFPEGAFLTYMYISIRLVWINEIKVPLMYPGMELTWFFMRASWPQTCNSMGPNQEWRGQVNVCSIQWVRKIALPSGPQGLNTVGPRRSQRSESRGTRAEKVRPRASGNFHSCVCS